MGGGCGVVQGGPKQWMRDGVKRHRNHNGENGDRLGVVTWQRRLIG